MSDNVVFMNLNTYAVAITTERGMSVTVRSNKAVKGDYFATWAQPKGPLSMVHESQVSPDAVVYEAKPWAVTDEAKWDELRKRVDPTLFNTDGSVKAADAEPPAEADPAAATVNTDETDKTEDKKKRKK